MFHHAEIYSTESSNLVYLLRGGEQAHSIYLSESEALMKDVFRIVSKY